MSDITKKSETMVEEDTVNVDTNASQSIEEVVDNVEDLIHQDEESNEDLDEEEQKSIIISEPIQTVEKESETDNISKEDVCNNLVMSFWKRGGMHIQDRTRCQDTAFNVGYDTRDPLHAKYEENHNRIKVVMDGCGSAEYSLIGVLLFEQEFKKKAAEVHVNSDNIEDIVRDIFQKMLRFDNEIQFILNNYLFTILICIEYDDRFEVFTCGDGYILYTLNNQIFFQELEDGEKNEQGILLPNYFAYDLDEVKGKLSNYKEGTEFSMYTLEKEKFSNVGVASDGLRFFKKLDKDSQIELFSMIYYRLPIGLGRLLEKHKGVFMDDFSISF